MGNFISNFDTTAELAIFSATTDFGRPHVSLTKDDSKIHYFEDPYKGHQYVEIGGLKWATMNIGASQPTDAGLYFQWGDISGYTSSQVGTDKVFNWTNYKYSDNGTTAMTKYNDTHGNIVLDASDDAAVANWGGSWRMPTTAEFQALGNAANTAWTDDYEGSGVKGVIVTDKTDSSKTLFFPAVGLCYNSNMGGVGDNGYYWSSSLSDYFSYYAFHLSFYDGNVNWGSNYQRFYGLPVRGVVG